jgi:poly-gamma-glutamate capsule biosynthesis protein CapA/YwtB (metallophosphatase superfamily)
VNRLGRLNRLGRPILALALALTLTGVAGGPSAHAGESGVVRLMAVGDMEMAFGVSRRIVNIGVEVPLADVADIFDDADIVVANLECSLSRNGEPWPNKQLHFGATPKAAEALAVGGVDVVSVANNHSLDFGPRAFLDTLELLDAAGVGHYGGGRNSAEARAPLIVERNGLRIAFLSYVTPFWGPYSFTTKSWEAKPDKTGIAIARYDDITADVTAARKVADVVVVSIHADGEYRRLPKRSQRRQAEAAISAGAALVIEHGPHVLQGYRRSGNTLIAYSLGNFVFPGYDGDARYSAILDVRLSAQGVESFSWIPIFLVKALPRPATEAETEWIMARLKPV